MTTSSRIDHNEYVLMRDYIEKNCGISISKEKVYLIETRLTILMVENGCANLTELYHKASADKSNALRDKIIDAMTTNETLWFRDKAPFTILENVLLNNYAQEISAGKRSKIRIWSAACSTGQEPYSIAITLNEFIKKQTTIKPHHIEITATDISPTVLYLAMAGRYDNLAISRGLSETLLNKYFTQQGRVWVVDDSIKKMVTYKKLNLQENLACIGKCDIVFCRNVLIYFSDEFKKNVLQRISAILQPEGYLFLGASESIINYSNDYRMHQYHSGLYYQIKGA